MQHTIENEFLSITINDLGAELCRIFDKEKNREVLWSADPAYWKRHAPILFPQVGKNYRGHFLYQGAPYATSQHGFARDSEFVLLEKTDSSITHRLVSTEDTLKKYPFAFSLTVTHILEARNITVKWHVENKSENTMYFCIGAHPAFNVPILPGTKQSDYILRFHRDELSYILLDPASGTAIPELSYSLALKNRECRVADDMFAKDALIFDNQIEWAEIALPDGTPYVSMSCPGFPNFGIWAAPGAPFICLEPWDGRCDNVGFEGEISEKPGILSLDADQEYNKSYVMTIH